MFYFISASSLPVTIWPIIGLAIANYKRNGDLNFAYVAITIPLIFGLVNYFTSYLKVTRTRKTMFLLGAVLGIIMAGIGSFYNVPTRVYGLEGAQRYLVFLGAPIFYGLIWSFPLLEIEKRLLKK